MTTWVERVYRYCRSRHTSKAIDEIINNLDDSIDLVGRTFEDFMGNKVDTPDKNFEELDKIISSLDLDQLSFTCQIAILCYTVKVKSRLPSRTGFYIKVKNKNSNRKDLESSLRGLE